LSHITNTISTFFGYFAKYQFPKFIQKKINKIYVSQLDIDLSDFDNIDTYDSLNALFTRKLKKQKDISTNEKDIISPCDAFITQMGTISKNKALHIKGREYDLYTLLSDFSEFSSKVSSRFDGGNYMNFYLSPKDYHCYHAPCDLTIQKAIHISGKLLPVNLKFLYKTEELFNNNERVILECKGFGGKFVYLVFVGALNVGSIKFTFDDKICTNIGNIQSLFHYEDLKIKKGELLGNFEMGSTIVMITQKGFLNPTINIEDNVSFGDVIAQRL
jgi:phosphatidylserine decarboxylase